MIIHEGLHHYQQADYDTCVWAIKIALIVFAGRPTSGTLFTSRSILAHGGRLTPRLRDGSRLMEHLKRYGKKRTAYFTRV